MLSVNVNGKWLDHHYKKLTDFSYAFYIGYIYIGQVFRMKYGWSAVSGKPNNVCPVDGFKSRHYAAEFLLNLQDYKNKKDWIEQEIKKNLK